MLIQTDEMEKGSNDPNRFKNRGGKLLEEEKKKKLLRKKLIRVFYIVLRFLNKFIWEDVDMILIFPKKFGNGLKIVAENFLLS